MTTPSTGSLDLKVGFRCNNDCLHCIIRDYEAALLSSGKPRDCTTEECLEMIRGAARRGLGHITLTGGEPTIRPDFFDLLKACQAAGLSAGVQTNGRCFVSRRFCERLADCGSPRFVIALHGDTPKVHDAISRRPGSWRQTRTGMRQLIEAGYRVTGKLVMSRLNAGCLTATLRLMHDIGLRDACFAYPHGHGNARIHYRDIAPRYTELRPEIDRLTHAAGELDFQLTLEAFPLCVLSEPQYVAEFQYLKDAERLCIPSHGDAFDWNASRPLEKRKMAACQACALDPYCEGPWKEYPETYGESEFQAQDQTALLDLLTAALKRTMPCHNDASFC